MSRDGYTSYFASGCVNLIGKHIDYNGGLVLPIAINLGTKGLYKKRDDGMIHLSSTTHEKKISFSINDIPEQYIPDNDWCNYPIGVIEAMNRAGIKITGFDLAFEGNLPEGSALSSSATIEVLTAYILLHQAGEQIDLPKLAVFCQQVENNFIGVKSGIMDQFAVANGKKDHAILLNCQTLAFEYIPFELDDYALLVMDTKRPRSLIKSAYNVRKTESEEALRTLIEAGKLNDGQSLVEADMQDLTIIENTVIKKRARHVVSENIRVKHAVTALEMGDLHTFGRLMNAAHASLKDHYEATGIELDTLAETAQNIDGCLGARSTGGGFGGCAIALVQKKKIKQFIEIISPIYNRVTGLQCEIYECQAEDGVRILA